MNKAPTPFDPTAWLEKKRLEKTLDSNADKNAADKKALASLSVNAVTINATLGSTLVASTPVLARTLPTVYEKFENFIDLLVLEQLKKPEDLLKLNPSRRESLGRFLSELCRIPEPENAQESLKNFTRIDRTETEHEALKQLFKQIALVQIGKAFLVKSWCANQKLACTKADLKDLTAAVERGLRPFMHLQTSTCQLIQRNFYSWYKLSAASQDLLWDLLNEIEDLNEAKEWLLCRAIDLSAETLGERDRYSKVFYQNLWKSIEKNKLFEPKGNTHYGFSPTLRDGSLIEYAPKKIEWMGFEPLSFELLFGEIRFLWKEPKDLPLWVKGSGLEMSMEQQSSMLLTHSGKQNVLQQMDAISCCEIALITEESLIRTQSRAMAAQALRKLVDQHAILKKLKQPTTTRGMYQACQALEKLRQGGILVWAREELLNESSGKPALSFILNQAKILLIADLSALQFDGGSDCEKLKRDIPKALYILKKDSNLESRKSHRPLMIKAYGSLKSENDVSILFDRVISLVQKPDQAFPLEPFQIHARVSPIDQREWEQHWFNPTDDQLVDRIEDLKRNATPLGQLAVVRTVHPAVDLHRTHEPDLFGNQNTQAEHGFYAWVESSKNGNEIYTASLRQLPEYMKTSHTLFWITPVQAQWSDPLQVLVRSQLTRDWFNYSVERKKGAWLLRESDLKSIPIPKHLSQFLMNPTEIDTLSDSAQKVLGQIPAEPGHAHKNLETLSETNIGLKAHAFVLASQVLQNIETHQGTLFSLVSPDEQIQYSKLFKTVMTDQDLQPLHQHPLVRFTATLSNHMAISQISVMKFPTPGILLTTAKGLTQQLFIQDTWLRERCFEMLQELQTQIAEPTWGELCSMIKIPKNPTQAQGMSQQILKAYAHEKMKRKELNHLLGACLMNPGTAQSKVGLLQ
jgi:hypothetical protein